MTAKLRLAAFAVAACLLLSATPVSSRPVIDELRLPDRSAVQATTAPAPCSDPSYNLLGAKQRNGSYSWSFDAGTIPLYLDHLPVLTVIKTAFDNVTGEHNDCGRTPSINATNTYLGTTSTRPNCNQPDGHNVIGFGKLDFGVLAVTCFWMSGGRITEADLKINTRVSWALSLNGCVNQVMLEATLTHEAGHVFGLAHVGEKRHGRLTMSPFIDGICENQEATLGLGDMRGLEALY